MIQKIDEGVYWKKSKFGYSFIYPIKKDLDKGFNFDNIDWKNFFGIRNRGGLIMTALFLIMILLLSYSYKHDTIECFKVIKDPCKYCLSYPAINPLLELNISNLTIKDGEAYSNILFPYS